MQNNEYLRHAGKKGMRWGYTEGIRNGKRTAGAVSSEISDGIFDDVSEMVDPKKQDAYVDKRHRQTR